MTTIEIGIYHRTDPSQCFEFAIAKEFGDEPTLVKASTFELEVEHLTQEEMLQRIWKDCNHTEASTNVIPEGVRSLAVGDVALIGETPFEVLMAGWAPLRVSEMIDALDTARQALADA